MGFHLLIIIKSHKMDDASLLKKETIKPLLELGYLCNQKSLQQKSAEENLN